LRHQTERQKQDDMIEKYSQSILKVFVEHEVNLKSFGNTCGLDFCLLIAQIKYSQILADKKIFSLIFAD
jgi:hypothetical protein